MDPFVSNVSSLTKPFSCVTYTPLKLISAENENAAAERPTVYDMV